MLRRSTVAALADSTSAYAPTSYDDAQALRTTVCNALDAEIVSAADAGDDATFEALGALETAVVLDFTTRSQSLATMQIVALGASLPMLVLAQRLYQDVSHYDALVRLTGPIKPCFAPVAFYAPVE